MAPPAVAVRGSAHLRGGRSGLPENTRADACPKTETDENTTFAIASRRSLSRPRPVSATPKGHDMRGTSQFFQTQIDHFTLMAAGSALPNQREMFLRAQIAWQALADKESSAQTERDKRTAERPPAQG